MIDLTIRHAQKNQPWTVPYSEAVVMAAEKGLLHVYGSHAALHAAKTVGKLAAVYEALDHSNDGVEALAQFEAVRAAAADLVTAALRLANLHGFDLETALVERVVEKNGVGFAPREDGR